MALSSWKPNWLETRQHFIDWWLHQGMVLTVHNLPASSPHEDIADPGQAPAPTFFYTQPRAEDVSGREGQRASLWSDSLFGWRYLAQRRGLFGLLWYFALVNFLLNFAMVLMGPLVLSYGTSTTLGIVQTAAGAGMLIGSIAVSA